MRPARHVGYPEARHHGGKGSGVLFHELAFHQGVLGPIHQLRQRDAVVHHSADQFSTFNPFTLQNSRTLFVTRTALRLRA